MTPEDLTEMYVHMQERDEDSVALGIQRALAKRAENSIGGDTNENNSGQQKEKTGNST